MKRALALTALCACASYGKAVPTTDAIQSSDAPVGCSITLSFNPTPAYAGANVRATAYVQGAFAIPTYAWQVKFNNSPIAYTSAATDDSAIDFLPATPGMYDVAVDIGFTSGCDPASSTLNVFMPGAGTADYRFHVVPPSDVAPPQDEIVEIVGGSAQGHDIALNAGLTPFLQVADSSGSGMPAYVRFLSSTSPAAFVEAFAGIDGSFQPRVLGQPYNVLVVPLSPAFAPQIIAWQPGTSQLVIDPGSVATGTVLDPAGSPLAGATVQLTSAGVPSTIATTASNGTFSVGHAFAAGAPVTVDVTPPAGRGLPRLTATSAFDLTSALSIHYAAALATTCDLSGLPVVRGGANKAGAVVTVVGSAAAGTVNTTAAAGTVRITATADGTGHLPSTKVPKASLTAVTQVVANDFAVAGLDESACGATSVSAPANVVATGTISGPSGVLQGAMIEASPTRALALAGAPAMQQTTDSAGHFSISLAAGGYYDLRFSDPLARAAPSESLDTNVVAAATTLPAALRVTGKVTVSGSPNPVPGTAVQVLCATCTGIDALRPIASGATDVTSTYRLAVPDPM